MTKMSRTTIMADDTLLDELRAIADEEGISLGEVIRQGLEWRARTRRRVPSFIGKLPPQPDGADRIGPPSFASDEERLIAEYIREKHDRLRDERRGDDQDIPR
jgi:hypothetical protein